MNTQPSLKTEFSRISRKWLMIGFSTLFIVSVPTALCIWKAQQDRRIEALASALSLAYRPMLLSGNVRDAKFQMEKAVAIVQPEHIQILGSNFSEIYPDYNGSRGTLSVACQELKTSCWSHDFQTVTRLVPIYYGDSGASELFGYVSLTLSTHFSWLVVLWLSLTVFLIFAFLGFIIPKRLSRIALEIERRTKDWADQIAAATAGGLHHGISHAPYAEFRHITPVMDSFSSEIEELKINLSEEAEARGRLRLLREVNHDLKTPISVLRRVLSVHRLEIEKGHLPDLSRIIAMEATLDKLNKMIRQIGGFEVKSAETKDKAICVSRFVEKYVGVFSETEEVRSHGAEIQIISSAKTFSSKIPESPLERIIDNLLRNALEAVSPGRGVICVECKSDSGRFSISVTDNGHGVPIDLRERIFDYGYTTKLGKGTGLGLGIIQKMAEEIGCTVKLEKSGPGGTTFTVEFLETGEALMEVIA